MWYVFPFRFGHTKTKMKNLNKDRNTLANGDMHSMEGREKGKILKFHYKYDIKSN